MKPEIEINLPFRGCGICKNIELVTTKAWAEDFGGEQRPVMVYHTCKNEDICRNAFDVWNWSETKD
jgi:hypothetical protein